SDVHRPARDREPAPALGRGGSSRRGIAPDRRHPEERRLAMSAAVDLAHAAHKPAAPADDAARFAALFTPLLPAAYRTARYLTRDPAEAEDLVQEAALNAFRGFHGFAAGTNFRAWFMRILT